VVDDLHVRPGVHAGEVGQEGEVEVGLIAEGAHDVRDVRHRDADLGLVVPLGHRAQEALAEASLEAGTEGSVHR
jgi:hypothetical protein